MEQQPRIHIARQSDGSWTVHPQPPLPATSTFLTGGWPEVARLREHYQAVDHFDSDDFDAFVAEFGPPPCDRDQEES